MGKNKQANRTKNNVRPSSSSHSAELLGTSIPTFFGLSAAKDGATAASGFSAEVDLNLDSNFQIVLKKMIKKDATTKLKALQEFTELCRNSEPDAVKTLLPFWPRLYCMLCTDVEHRVREAAHIAHKVVISKVKRSIAPYLKQIAGPWFTSQYDSYPPAARAATSAFEEAFSPNKLNEAIIFCQEEILNYIYDNLIKHTPQTLSNPNTTSVEQMEAKYERVVISSLLGFSLYLKKLTLEQLKESEPTAKKIISAPKFWKYSKHESSLVKNSFYVALIALCQHAPFLLNSEAKTVVNTVFVNNNLDESDPIVLPTIWEAALNVVLIKDSWSQVLNLEKKFFRKLNVMLKGGGCGNASRIFPNLLPLISKLPSDFLSKESEFYYSFFENMKLGLEANVVNQSRVEGRVVAVTFVECLQYMIMSKDVDDGVCKELISKYLLKALETKMLAPNCFKLCPSIPLMTQIALLLRQRQHSENAEDLRYQSLVNLIWSLFGLMYENMILSTCSEEVLTHILHNQVEFLFILQDPCKYKSKGRERVRFEDEKSSEIEEPKSSNVEVDDPNFVQTLLSFVKKTVSMYFKNTVEKESTVYLPHINKIISKFDSKEILEEIVTSRQESSIFTLFTSLFSNWLKNPKMRVAEVIDLSFYLLPHVSHNEKELILKTLVDNWSQDTLHHEIWRAILRFSSDDCVKAWIRSSEFTQSIVELTRKFVDGDYGSEDIIKMIFKARCNNEEQLINISTANEVINILSNNIRMDGSKNHVNVMGQELVLLCSTSEYFHNSTFKELFISLFHLSCYTDFDSSYLISACEPGLSTVLARSEDLENFSERLAEAIREIIFQKDVTYDLDRIITNISLYIDLICCKESDSKDSQSKLKFLLPFLQDPEEMIFCQTCIEKCCIGGFHSLENFDLEYLKMPIQNEFLETIYEESTWLKQFTFYKDIRQDVVDELSFEMVAKYVKWTTYVGSLLVPVLTSYSRLYTSLSLENLLDEVAGLKEKDSIEYIQPMVKIIDVIFKDIDEKQKNTLIAVSKEILNLMFKASLLNAFCKYYANTKYNQILEEQNNSLKKISRDIFKNTSDLENVSCYCTIEFLVAAKDRWRLIAPSLNDILERNFIMKQNIVTSDYVETVFREKISNRSVEAYHLLEMSYLIKNYSQLVTEKQWDLIFIYMDSFFQKLSHKPKFDEMNLRCISAISRLFLEIKKCFRENHLKPMEERVPPDSFEVYNKVVELDFCLRFFTVWKSMAEEWYDKHIRLEFFPVLENVCQVVISNLSLMKHDDPSKSVSLAKDYGRYITSSHPVLQVTSSLLLISCVPDLVKLDTKMFHENISQMSTETREGSSLFKNVTNCNWSSKNLENVIFETQNIVEKLLCDFVIGGCCSLEPFTDSFSYTYAYLLLWSFILEMCGEAHSPLRFQYACWLQEKGYSTCLIESVLKLMPQSVLHGLDVKENYQKYFESSITPDLREPVKSDRIEQVACFVYRMFVQRLPNVLREWWNQSENKASALVEKVTSFYVSPILISNELKNVQQDRELENMVIKTYITAREVVATYTIDEVKMDLVLTLPTNHPLGTIKIESGNVVVSASNWRSWLFNISKYLIHQNGTIWDALVIWKNNLDKKFEGVEECYICFSILQGSTLEVPKLCCHTCKKKFHSSCLYTWFNTSNKSTCPICRNLF